EHTLLDEGVDRLRETLVGDRRDRLGRLTYEALAIVRVRRRQSVRGEVGDRDVDRRIRLRARKQTELPQLLVRIEAVPALHSDRRRAELGGVGDTPHEQCEQLVVAGVARRANGRVDPAAGREDRQIISAAFPGREFLPALARVAEMRVRIDEAWHDDAALDIDIDRALDA